MSRARLWYIDGYNTYGIPGLAQVHDAVATGLLQSNPGPDMDLLGTAKDCVRFLRAYGFTNLVTEDEELLRAWNEVINIDSSNGGSGSDSGSSDTT